MERQLVESVVKYNMVITLSRRCFCCGMSCHKDRDCPNLKSHDKDSGKAQSSGFGDAPNKNRFDALRCRGKKESSLHVVTSILRVLFHDVYVLLDPNAAL